MLKKGLVSAIAIGAISACSAQISDESLNSAYLQPNSGAKIMLEKMSMREKIGQMMMLDFRFWGKDKQGELKQFTVMNDHLKNVIHDYHLGGVILFRDNLHNTAQSVKLVNEIQAARSNMPLFIATDQEGGYVTRLREGTEMPGNMALGATRDVSLAEKAGQVHGLELSALGINFNFGPVVDVNVDQRNPIIGVRSYGNDLNLIDEMSTAYIKGIHQYNILTSAKHFPGHGNVSVDSHSGLPVVPYSSEQWHKVDLKAFENVFEHGVDSVMTAHVVVPAIDDAKLTSPLTGAVIGTPATLSKKILTGVLRDELHFKGLIVTDALDMGAIANNFEPTWTIETSILAGSDVILMPVRVRSIEAIANLEAVYAHLEQQAKVNPELAKRIDESALRILETKLKNKISAKKVEVNYAKKVVASAGNKAAEADIAERSITLIENLPLSTKNQKVLPFKLQKKTNILVISDEATRNSLIESELKNIAKQFSDVDINVTKLEVEMTRNDLDKVALQSKIKAADYVIVVTYNLKGSKVKNAQQVIDITNALNKPTVVIASRNPYDIAYLQNVKANIAIYGITGFDVTNNNRNSLEANVRAGVRSLFRNPETGKAINAPSGKLPVDIKSADDKTILYPFGHGLTY